MSKDKKKKHNSFGLLFSRLFGKKDTGLSFLEEEKMRSPFKTSVKNFTENKIAMSGLIVFLIIFLACFILPIFFPLDVTFQDVTQQDIYPGFSMLNVPKDLIKNGVRQIEVGATYSVGLDEKGNVYMWGKLSDKLKKMPDNMRNIEQISAGMNHVLALDSLGRVYTWGFNRLRLDRVPEEVKELNNIKQIEAGQQISFVLTDDGYLYHWGNENLISLSYEQYQGQIDKITSNTVTLMAILKDGSVVSLGGTSSPFARIPENMGTIVDIASNDKAAMALNENGEVFVWGSKDYGLYDIPEGIQGNVKQIAAGRSHFTVLTKDGAVYSWGRNNYKQTNVPKIDKASDIFVGSYQNYALTESGKIKTWGLKGYFFGTDNYGRDIFTRIVSGGRMTMTIGAIAVIISTIIGVIIGGLSGYYGGKVDNLLMRFAEIVNSLPFLPFAMILSSFIGNSISEIQRISLIMVILGVLSWPGLARLVRAQILAEREKEFVTAAKAMGIKEAAIIFKHIIPNVITVVIVDTTLAFAGCMLTESSLSFLGFGVVEPSPTWGNMLTGAQSSQVIGQYWWRWIFPSLALSLSTISINLIGDGLRDAIDPRSNER